ncbi:MAG TPA: ornithine carbamoyltransferase [Terriglobales bacterium]|nr:ornithine carbamoyltransferase [Terriglobales bacterium]
MKTNLLNPRLGHGASSPYPIPAPRLPKLGVDDLINLSQLTRKEFLALLDLAADIKVHPGRYRDLLSGCGLAMIFEKPSLRTRVTFDVAMQEMGGHAVFLDFTESPLGEREDILDVARNLELWMDAIVARTFGHESIELLAKASAVPVINGLSDHSHPCQAMADFLTLRETFDDFPHIKLAYVGDGNNTCHSLLEAAALSGCAMAVATPPGYEPDAGVVERAQAVARRTGAKLSIGNQLGAALRGAHAVYTDTWASMGQEAEQTQRARDFAGYQVNEGLMARAKPGARFLHCLPAHRGLEVSTGVIDAPISLVYQQAENRLHAQKAILAALILGNHKEPHRTQV